MQKGIIVLAALLLMVGAVFAAVDSNVRPTLCVSEGRTMPVYPGYACCSGLTAIPTTGTDSAGNITALVGASICSKCGNGTCEQWENYANCPADCNQPVPPITACTDSDGGVNYYVKGEVPHVAGYDPNIDTCLNQNGIKSTAGPSLLEYYCVNTTTWGNEVVPCANGCENGACLSDTNTQPTDVLEKVHCIFKNNTSGAQQSCYTEPSYAGCKGINDCWGYTTEARGKQLTWKSAGCSGTGTTTMDGIAEDVTFDCSSQTACTEEYAPVCGQIMITPPCVSTATNCPQTAVQKTYANSCFAGLAGAKILYNGACTTGSSDNNLICGGIAGIACPQGYVCVYDPNDANVADASGKCVPIGSNCPEIVPPAPTFCPNGTISIAIDSTGCKKYVCTPPMGDYYRTAYWTCSNGTSYTKTSDACISYSEWKKRAAQSCAQSTNCTTTGTSTTTTATANTNATTTTTATTNTTGPNLATNTSDSNLVSDSNIATDSNAVVGTNCAGGGATVTMFKVSDQCRPECTQSTDAQGCTTVSCPNGIISTSCPATTTNTACYTQSWDEIRAIKDNCYAAGGQVVINFDNNCNKYSCISSTTTTADANRACTTPDKVPQEKIDYCRKNGGEFVTKVNGNGCLILVDCIGAQSGTAAAPINKKILSDKVSLLSLAVMLESLRIDLEKTQGKVLAIADYYSAQGDANAAARFKTAADLIGQAITQIDSSKSKIRDNIDTFSEDDALIVRNAIQDIRDTILARALLSMLQ